MEKKRILLTNLPEDYIRISSGLGETRPVNIVVLPILLKTYWRQLAAGFVVVVVLWRLLRRRRR